MSPRVVNRQSPRKFKCIFPTTLFRQNILYKSETEAQVTTLFSQEEGEKEEEEGQGEG